MSATRGHGQPAGPVKDRRHYITAGLASMIGTTIEWYDFFIYGTAAAPQVIPFRITSRPR